MLSRVMDIMRKAREMHTQDWILLGVLALYLVLQFYVLPKLGVPT